MMITISAGETIEEIREAIAKLAKIYGMTLVAKAEETSVTVEAEKPVTEKKTRGRKKAETTETVEEIDTVIPSTPLIEIASKEQAMVALTDLNGKKGLPVARALLLEFGANRFSELKEEHFAEFVAKAKTLAA